VWWGWAANLVEEAFAVLVFGHVTHDSRNGQSFGLECLDGFLHVFAFSADKGLKRTQISREYRPTADHNACAVFGQSSRDCETDSNREMRREIRGEREARAYPSVEAVTTATLSASERLLAEEDEDMSRAVFGARRAERRKFANISEILIASKQK